MSVLGALVAFAALLPAPLQETKSAECLADFEQALGTIRTQWSYLEMRRERSGLDLEARAAHARGLLGEVASPQSLHIALTYLVAGLQDGHAWVAVPGVKREGARRWPVSLVQTREGILVGGVSKRIETTLQVGDRLLAVNGRPLLSWVKEAEEMVFASSDLSRRRQALDWIVRATSLESVRLAVLPQGKSKAEQVELPCPPVWTPTPELREVLPEIGARMLEDGIGYLRPGGFSASPGSGWSGAPPEKRDEILADRYAEFHGWMEAVAEAEVLIVDLRGNPGGTDLLGQELAGMLLPQDTTYFRLSARRAFGRWSGPHSHPVRPSDQAPSKASILCLIDERTYSTADNFAVCLRDTHPDVQFIGRPNGAGTGAPRPFVFDATGASIIFCTQRVYGPAGGFIEGHSIRPDHPVLWTREDFLQGRDPDLDLALQLARGRLMSEPE